MGEYKREWPILPEEIWEGFIEEIPVDLDFLWYREKEKNEQISEMWRCTSFSGNSKERQWQVEDGRGAGSNKIVKDLEYHMKDFWFFFENDE